MPSLARSRGCLIFGSPFEKMDSFVSLEHHKTKRREGEEGRVSRHILGGRTRFNMTETLKRKEARTVTSEDVKPCTDGDPRRMSPTSGLFAGSFALMFQVSVHWGRSNTYISAPRAWKMQHKKALEKSKMSNEVFRLLEAGQINFNNQCK